MDAILPNPSNYKEAYFFSGNQYALINVQPGTYLIVFQKALATTDCLTWYQQAQQETTLSMGQSRLVVNGLLSDKVDFGEVSAGL